MSTAAHAQDADLERRFGGLTRLYGVTGAARLRRAHAAVVGVGGVGSWAAEALARSGLGYLTLIDMDHVAESNINRQVQALGATLGAAKVQALRERIADIHPGCIVNGIEAFVSPENWPALVPDAVDAVIDACDQMPAKVAIAAWARAVRGRLLITVGAAGGKRMAHRIEIDDLSRATHDPLLAQMRQRLRRDHGAPREGRAMGLSCVFSREAVAPPDPSCAVGESGAGDGSLNCHGYGSTVAVTAAFGFAAAGWVLDRIAQGASATPSDTGGGI